MMNEKVKIPKDFAEWISSKRLSDLTMIDAITDAYYDDEREPYLPMPLYCKLDNATLVNKLIVGIVNGYEVEEPKKYRLKLKYLTKSSKYINMATDTRRLLASSSDETLPSYQTSFTEAEAKKNTELWSWWNSDMVIKEEVE